MMIEKKIVFEYTDTFDNTTESAIAHFSQWSDGVDVITRVERLIEEFEEGVASNPQMYSRCSELAQFGNTEIRSMTKDGFRLLYEPVESDGEVKIVVLLLLGQRQSIQEQLITHCLIYKK